MKQKPLASSDSSQSMMMVQTGYGYRRVAMLVLVVLVVVALCLIFIPWRQSVTGVGKVIVFSPMDRPQTVQAQISSRIVRWHVKDGQSVKAGDLLVALTDIDPKFLDPQQIPRMESQLTALKQRRSAAETRANALIGQIAQLTDARNAAVPGATERARQARDRLAQANQALEAARQNYLTTSLNQQRIRDLYEKGLRSRRDYELAELENVRGRTEVERAQAAVAVAEKDLNVTDYDRNRVAADTAAGLQSVQASLASAQETIASTTSDILKLEVDLWNVRQRRAQREIRSPREGRVVRLLNVGAGETVDQGDVLAVIAPKTQDQAVELFVSDFDTPLVSVGRSVRLLFTGWPAVQFVGWPSVAVGTFAGKVSVIDAVDDGKGRYRMIVQPDWAAIKSGKETPWPSPAHLRPGASTTGWIMLDYVPLWFELWRIFNALPPSIQRGAWDGSSKAVEAPDEAFFKGASIDSSGATSGDEKSDKKPKKRKAK